MEVEFRLFTDEMWITFQLKAQQDVTGLRYPADPWNAFPVEHLRRRMAEEVGEWIANLSSADKFEMLEIIQKSARAPPKKPETGRLIHSANLAFILYTALRKAEIPIGVR